MRGPERAEASVREGHDPPRTTTQPNTICSELSFLWAPGLPEAGSAAGGRGPEARPDRPSAHMASWPLVNPPSTLQGP